MEQICHDWGPAVYDYSLTIEKQLDRNVTYAVMAYMAP